MGTGQFLARDRADESLCLCLLDLFIGRFLCTSIHKSADDWQGQQSGPNQQFVAHYESPHSAVRWQPGDAPDHLANL
jgi:hypothetical protein